MSARRAEGTAWGAFLWITCLVLWLTWAPFLPREQAASVLWGPPGSVADVLVNVVLLLPAGLVLGLGAERSRPWREGVRAAAVLGSVVVLAEGGQLYFAGRHVSLFDALLNLAGGTGGYAAAVRLRAAGFRPRTVLLLTGSHLFFGVVVYVAGVGAHVRGGHRLAEWRPEFGVRVGGEFEAPRDYRGRVDTARICARHGGEEVCVAGGAPPAARRRLTRLALRGQHVELAATVRSSGEQRGPTRIVTFSTSEALRNATLGQSGRDLVLRLRTPLAGPNGSRVEFVLPGAVPTGTRTRVRAVYDRGRVRLASRWNGKTVRRSFDYRLLTVARLVAWQISGYRPFQLAMAAAVGLAALFFPVGYGAALMLRGSPLSALGAAAAGSAVVFGVTAEHLGVGWGWSWAGCAAATAVLGALGGLWDTRTGVFGEAAATVGEFR